MTKSEVREMADELGPPDPALDPPSAPTTPIAVADSAPRSTDVERSATTPASPSGATRFFRVIDDGPKAKPWHVLSIVLLVLGCVLAPIGVTTNWARNLVVNQDDYLAAVQPLITNPAIITAAENRLVTGIDDAITSLNLADKIGDELQTLGLPPKLATLATSYLATFRVDVTNAITKLVDELLQSPKLATIWDSANAELHTKFVQIMQGEPGKLNSLNVDLSAAVAELKQKLQSSGVQWASQIPDIPVVINVSGNANVERVAGYYDLLNTLGTWLPIIAALLLLVSILIAPSRLGGLSKAAGWLAASMVALTLALIAGREWLVSKAPLQPDVTEAFTRQLTVNLQSTVRLIIVVAAVISVVAWLFGRSRSAVGLRRAVVGLADRVQDTTWGLVIRVGAGVVALVLVLVLVSLDNPGLVTAIVLALLAGLAAVIAANPHASRAPIPPGDHAGLDASDNASVPG
jgi:hypothetical protein